MQLTSFRSTLVVGLTILGLGIVSSLHADSPPSEVGLAVGQKAPDFTLVDQTGERRSLDSLLEKGKLAIVFYRSADWWPYCQKQLVELQKNTKKFQENGIEVVGVSYDDERVLARFAKKRDIGFPLLSDAGSKTIDAYGVRNREVPDPRIDGVPHPGTFIVDREGVIRAKLFHEGYKERHVSEQIIEAVKNLD